MVLYNSYILKENGNNFKKLVNLVAIDGKNIQSGLTGTFVKRIIKMKIWYNNINKKFTKVKFIFLSNIKGGYNEDKL